jgi:hypothetical protein
MKYFVRTKLSEHLSKTPEGFLVCLSVPIARTGDQVYGAHELPLDPDENGTITITRSPEEVFRPETLASFEGKPITVTHPEEHVTPETWKDVAVGNMHNIRQGKGEYEDSILADLLITEQDAINAVMSGLREVSCGYDAEYEQDEPGKGKQKFIVGNHLALVQKGRAGSSYAINDHEGVTKMSLKEKVRKIFAKAQDEAMKVVSGDDGEQSKQDPQSGKPATADEGMKAYDAMCAQMKDFMEKMKPKGEDASEDPPPKKDDAESEDAEEGAGLEDRLSKLEAAVSKLLEAKAGDAEEEMSEDADEEDPKKEKSDDADEEESEDGDFEKSSMVGDSADDTASRAEILSPGIAMSKDVKKKALKACLATKDGEKILKALNGGKTPTFDSKEKVNMLFRAASEVLKATRKGQLAKSKTFDVDGRTEVNSSFKTADELNAINAKFYNKGAH